MKNPAKGKGQGLPQHYVEEEMQDFILPKESFGICYYQLNVLTVTKVTNSQLLLQGAVGENHHLKRGDTAC